MSLDRSTDARSLFAVHLNIGNDILQNTLQTFLQLKSYPFLTEPGVDVVELPNDITRLKSITVTVNNIRYTAQEVFSEKEWLLLTSFVSGSESDMLQKCFRRATTVEIYPRPSSANPGVMLYEGSSKFLSVEDVTGGVTNIVDKTVTWSGAAIDQSFVGRYFKMDIDGEWYKIGSVTNATTFVLSKAYVGGIISGNATIGQMPLIPGPAHHIPVMYALWQYYLVKKDAPMARIYKAQYDEQTKWARSTFSQRYATNVISPQNMHRTRIGMLDPNEHPRNLS